MSARPPVSTRVPESIVVGLIHQRALFLQDEAYSINMELLQAYKAIGITRLFLIIDDSSLQNVHERASSRAERPSYLELIKILVHDKGFEIVDVLMLPDLATTALLREQRARCIQEFLAKYPRDGERIDFASRDPEAFRAEQSELVDRIKEWAVFLVRMQVLNELIANPFLNEAKRGRGYALLCEQLERVLHASQRLRLADALEEEHEGGARKRRSLHERITMLRGAASVKMLTEDATVDPWFKGASAAFYELAQAAPQDRPYAAQLVDLVLQNPMITEGSIERRIAGVVYADTDFLDGLIPVIVTNADYNDGLVDKSRCIKLTTIVVEKPLEVAGQEAEKKLTKAEESEVRKHYLERIMPGLDDVLVALENLREAGLQKQDCFRGSFATKAESLESLQRALLKRVCFALRGDAGNIHLRTFLGAWLVGKLSAGRLKGQKRGDVLHHPRGMFFAGPSTTYATLCALRDADKVLSPLFPEVDTARRAMRTARDMPRAESFGGVAAARVLSTALGRSDGAAMNPGERRASEVAATRARLAEVAMKLALEAVCPQLSVSTPATSASTMPKSLAGDRRARVAMAAVATKPARVVAVVNPLAAMVVAEKTTEEAARETKAAPAVALSGAGGGAAAGSAARREFFVTGPTRSWR